MNLRQPVPELPVSDVEEAQDYYERILGFKKAWLYPDKSIGAVCYGEVAIFFRKTETKINPNVHWVHTSNIEETYSELKSRGVIVAEDLEVKPWDLKQFTIADCFGHVFIFHQEID